LAFHSNYDPVLYRFPDKARYWSKISTVSYPTCIRASAGHHPNIAIMFEIGKKARFVVPADDEKLESIFTRFDTIQERNRRTDRLKNGRHRPHYAKRRAAKIFSARHDAQATRSRTVTTLQRYNRTGSPASFLLTQPGQLEKIVYPPNPDSRRTGERMRLNIFRVV